MRAETKKAAKAAYDAAYRVRNKERVAANKRAYALANPEAEKARVSAWVAANRERSREIKREYKARNPDADRLYAEANSEAIKAKADRYYAENRELICAKQRAYGAENKVTIASYKTAYQKRRPEVHRKAASLRRSGVGQATPAWADKAAIKAVYVAARAAGAQVDHIIPLKGLRVSGLHVANNLQLLSKLENQRKGRSHAG